MKTSKIKEQIAKKTVFLIKAISVLWGGGKHIEKKILKSKKKFFFLNFQNLENPYSWWGRGCSVEYL